MGDLERQGDSPGLALWLKQGDGILQQLLRRFSLVVLGDGFDVIAQMGDQVRGVLGALASAR